MPELPPVTNATLCTMQYLAHNPGGFVNEGLGEGRHQAGTQQAFAGQARRRQDGIDIYAVLVDILLHLQGADHVVGINRDDRRCGLDDGDIIRPIAFSAVIRQGSQMIDQLRMRL